MAQSRQKSQFTETTLNGKHVQELLCSLRSTHAAMLSIEYVTTFCLPNMNDRRRFKSELTGPPDGLNVTFSDDTPTK